MLAELEEDTNYALLASPPSHTYHPKKQHSKTTTSDEKPEPKTHTKRKYKMLKELSEDRLDANVDLQSHKRQRVSQIQHNEEEKIPKKSKKNIKTPHNQQKKGGEGGREAREGGKRKRVEEGERGGSSRKSSRLLGDGREGGFGDG